MLTSVRGYYDGAKIVVDEENSGINRAKAGTQHPAQRSGKRRKSFKIYLPADACRQVGGFRRGAEA